MLNAERPGNDFWIDLVGNEAAGRSARSRLGSRRHVHLQESAAGQKASARGAPCWTTRQRASDGRILLGLKLWRQAIDREVVGDDVIRNLCATTNRPSPAARWIPGKSQVRPEVVGVGFRLAEEQAGGRIVGDGVESLFGLIARDSRPLVAESEIEGKAVGEFPIVLHEPVQRVVVVGGAASAGSAKRPVGAVRDKVIDEGVEGRVVPFTAGSGQIVRRGDVVAAFDSEFEGVLAADVAQVVDDLVDVLRVALRSKAVWPYVAAEFVDLDVRKIRKLGGREIVWAVQARVGCPKVVDEATADGP